MGDDAARRATGLNAKARLRRQEGPHGPSHETSAPDGADAPSEAPAWSGKTPDEVMGLVKKGFLAAEPAALDPHGAPASWRGDGPYKGIKVEEATIEGWIAKCDVLSARLAGLASSSLALCTVDEMRAYLAPIARYIDFPTLTVPFKAIARGEIDFLARDSRAKSARDESLRRLRAESTEDPISSIRSSSSAPRRIADAGPLLLLECEIGFEERGPISRATASRLYPSRARLRELLLCGGPAWPVVKLASPQGIAQAEGALSEDDLRRCCAIAVSDAAFASCDPEPSEATKNQVSNLRKGRYDPEAALEGYLQEASGPVSAAAKMLSEGDAPGSPACRRLLQGPATLAPAARRLAALIMINRQDYVVGQVRPTTGASPPALTRERLEMLRTARPKNPKL